MADENPNAIPDATLATVRTHYAALVALAEATVALKKGRDLILMQYGNSLAAASIHILVQTASALVAEMGQQIIATGQASKDPDVTSFVALLVDRVHHTPPVTVPPEDPPA